MTKNEFAKKLYFELRIDHDVQKTVDSIKSVKKGDKTLSVEEQLEIAELIKKTHRDYTTGYFEDVSAFLVLVNQVEEMIKMQNDSNSDGGKNAN